jgi:hypothetical protein
MLGAVTNEIDDRLDKWWNGLPEDKQQMVLDVRHKAFAYDDPVREIIDSSGCTVPPPWKFGEGGRYGQHHPVTL